MAKTETTGKSTTTFHGKKGRFCGSGSAHTVTKGGERFKVIRQHRRMKPKSPGKTKVKRSARTVAKETVDRMALVRSKGSLIDHIDGRLYVSMKELLGGG